MNLPDFTKFEQLNELRRQMGADLKPWSPFRQWSRFNPDEWRRLQSEGIEVQLSEVVPSSDGTLEYRGEKVVLYIRDQRASTRRAASPYLGYRYHVADCTTLNNMRDKGRFERYVVSTRKDGKFVVNRFNFSQLIEKEIEVEIPICRNCLRFLNYGNYNSISREQKDAVWEGFDLIQYFEKYSTRVPILPRHTEYTAPLDTYSDNWEEISNHYREGVNWRCEACGLTLENHRSFLHVHHKNGVRSDNRRENLEALCIKCHSERPDHEQLRNSPDYSSFMQMRPSVRGGT